MGSLPFPAIPVWKIVLEKASQNTLGHMKLGSEKNTGITKTRVDMFGIFILLLSTNHSSWTQMVASFLSRGTYPRGERWVERGVRRAQDGKTGHHLCRERESGRSGYVAGQPPARLSVAQA